MCDLGAQLTASLNQLCAGFCWGGKLKNSEKNPFSREANQRNLNPFMALTPGIEPGPHRWEVSALTTEPSLLPELLQFSVKENNNKTLWFLVPRLLWNCLDHCLCYNNGIFIFLSYKLECFIEVLPLGKTVSPHLKNCNHFSCMVEISQSAADTLALFRTMNERQ